MPIAKFRDVSEMPGPARIDPTGPHLWRKIAAWMGLSRRLAPRHWPPGVYKNRTMDEANRRRESWRTPPHA